MSETVGEILRRTRKERKVSLEQVSTATHIRLHYLEALENDLLDQLPSEVQGRGFLRLYADYLSLPVQPLLDLWDGKASQPDQPPVSIETSPTRPPEKPLPSIEINDAPASIETEFPETIPASAQNAPSALPKADELFREIGATLRQQRENLGLALKDIEHYTHVRLHYLKLLEEGKFNELPSLVQARGMLNNYAHFLEADTEALLLKFADAIQIQFAQRSAPNTRQAVTSKEPAQQRTRLWRLFTPDLLIGGAVIVLLVSFTIWAASRISSANTRDFEATAPPFSQVLSLATPFPTPSGEVTASRANPEEGNAPQASPALPLLSEVPISMPQVAEGRLQVYVVARQRAFMRVSVDGKTEFNGRVVPGNAYPFAANNTIELTAGNAAALQIFYNQNDLGTLGSTGQVVRLIFTPNGVITPTPSATQTPAVTPTPSLTAPPTPTMPLPSVTPLIP
ncbi:MAG: DUF4115 domain-containing protein [Anaerolineae bacterium]|nr:DUF4115 domain-containing protein [Anaerolineae bacterium]